MCHQCKCKLCIHPCKSLWIKAAKWLNVKCALHTREQNNDTTWSSKVQVINCASPGAWSIYPYCQPIDTDNQHYQLFLWEQSSVKKTGISTPLTLKRILFGAAQLQCSLVGSYTEGISLLSQVQWATELRAEERDVVLLWMGECVDSETRTAINHP